MNRYMDWELYEEPPEGFSIDKHTGSPLFGYDFFTGYVFTTDYYSIFYR